jgi:hypothetical protein
VPPPATEQVFASSNDTQYEGWVEAARRLYAGAVVFSKKFKDHTTDDVFFDAGRNKPSDVYEVTSDGLATLQKGGNVKSRNRDQLRDAKWQASTIDGFLPVLAALGRSHLLTRRARSVPQRITPTALPLGRTSVEPIG